MSLDVSDPAAPREVSRLVLGPDDVPHWISVSPDHRRVAITGYGTLRHRVLLARLDPGTGRLTLDERFREEGSAEPGFTLHDGIPHGAVFGRP